MEARPDADADAQHLHDIFPCLKKILFLKKPLHLGKQEHRPCNPPVKIIVAGELEKEIHQKIHNLLIKHISSQDFTSVKPGFSELYFNCSLFIFKDCL